MRVGSYKFTRDRIIEFATLYDPQPFHMDEEAARKSLFGGLCASGWHTASVWMKLQREFVETQTALLQKKGEPVATFGPSPGFRDLKWLRPVFLDDEVTYHNTVKSIRETRSRLGWWLLTVFHEGHNQDDEPVISFESTVLVNLAGASGS